MKLKSHVVGYGDGEEGMKRKDKSITLFCKRKSIKVSSKRNACRIPLSPFFSLNFLLHCLNDSVVTDTM